MSEELQFGFDGMSESKRKSSSSNDTREQTIDVDENVGDFIIAVLNQSKGRQFWMPAHSDNSQASELNESETDFLGREGLVRSLESIFDVEVERPYVGDLKIRENEDGESVSTTDEYGNDSVDRHITIQVMKWLNGNFSDEITSAFGEDAQIKVGSPRKGDGNFEENPEERPKWVKFWIVNSDSGTRTRLKAMENYGNLEQPFEVECLRRRIPPNSRYASTTSDGPVECLVQFREHFDDEEYQELLDWATELEGTVSVEEAEQSAEEESEDSDEEEDSDDEIEVETDE